MDFDAIKQKSKTASLWFPRKSQKWAERYSEFQILWVSKVRVVIKDQTKEKPHQTPSAFVFRVSRPGRRNPRVCSGARAARASASPPDFELPTVEWNFAAGLAHAERNTRWLIKKPSGGASFVSTGRFVSKVTTKSNTAENMCIFISVIWDMKVQLSWVCSAGTFTMKGNKKPFWRDFYQQSQTQSLRWVCALRSPQSICCKRPSVTHHNKCVTLTKLQEIRWLCGGHLESGQLQKEVSLKRSSSDHFLEVSLNWVQ